MFQAQAGGDITAVYADALYIFFRQHISATETFELKGIATNFQKSKWVGGIESCNADATSSRKLHTNPF